MSIAVLLADACPRQRQVHSVQLNSEPDIDVVAQCADGATACEDARRLLPDVVLTALDLPGTGGVALTRLLARQRGTSVVVVADTDAPDQAFRALHAGASGYLLRGSPGGELARAIRRAACGQAHLAPRITRPVIDRCIHQPDAPDLHPLTPREREVLRLIGTGLSTQEIADRLILSRSTVKSHVGHIFRKLGVRSRTRLVAIAHESGLMGPPPVAARTPPEGGRPLLL
ncbi:LuxR C-terminal-related transcriptional regulator [Streptomyces boninensis]|uniref:LuxR C-terminal-related transcriptional regulator n=1 Tax=Streptomyces boninensis TaxID=2039455 RepID=UPI003B20CA1E